MVRKNERNFVIPNEVRNLQSIFLLEEVMQKTYSPFVKGLAKRSGVQECEEY